MIFQDSTTGQVRVMLTILPLEGRANFYNKFTLLLPMKLQLRLAAWTDLLHCTKRFIIS